MNWVFCG